MTAVGGPGEFLGALLLEPFDHAFMRRALGVTLAVGVAAPVLGAWAVPRRVVYLADAMSHALLAGVALAAVVGGSLLAGGVAAAATMAVVVVLLVVRARVPVDGAIGVTGQGLFALGVLVVSTTSDPRALSHVLFGNPLTATAADVLLQAVLATLVVTGAVAWSPALTATTVDREHARSVGMRPAVVDAVLVGGVALVVVLGLTAVGVLMTVALMVAPAVAARLLRDEMGSVVRTAALLGAVAATAGLLLAYHLDLPVGPTVALLAVAEVALAAGAGGLRPTRSDGGSDVGPHAGPEVSAQVSSGARAGRAR